MIVRLAGCRSEPLGAYLQGLGAWRAVTRLADPDATAWWDAGALAVESTLDTDDLVELLRDRFEPLAVVSPWNEGSGFAGNGKSAEAERTLATVRESTDARLATVRAAILAADRVVAAGRAAGLAGQGGALWDKAAKPQVLALCRAMLPDEALPWLDASAVLGQDRDGTPKVSYSRLLGTGGNFGRQDLQTTYLLRALTVLSDPRGVRRSEGWLRGALFGDESMPYLKETVGQFDPGRAGGIQSSPREDGSGLANPWAFLLTVEGAVLFASAATRRQGAVSADAAVPFVVRPSPVGYGTGSAGEKAHAEVWAPQWDRPATLPEIAHLLAEGRATWNGRTARTGLDLVRSVSSLGVDRGISRFTRSVIAERLGQSPLAVPVGTVEVRERAGAALLGQLDPWLDRLRRGDLPAGIETQVRHLDAALYAAAADGAAARMREVLITAGRLHDAVARSGAARDKVRPLVLTAAVDWWKVAGPRPGESGGAGLRVAVALSSATDGDPRSTLRGLLSPVVPGRQATAWTGRPPTVAGGTAVEAVAAAHRRRSLTGAVDDEPDDGWPEPALRGRRSSYRWAARAAGLADAAALATGEDFPAAAFADHMRGWLLLRWEREDRTTVGGGPARPAFLPPALALLAPFYGAGPLSAVLAADRGAEPVLLRPAGDWLPRVLAGDTGLVLAAARQRLAAAGLSGLARPRVTRRSIDPAGLAAALLVPLTDADRQHCLDSVYTHPSTTTERDSA